MSFVVELTTRKCLLLVYVSVLVHAVRYIIILKYFPMTDETDTTRPTTMILPLTAPYSTTDTPPPTPHHALNDCESLRSLSLRGSRDVKEEECHLSVTYGYFSRNSHCKRFCTAEEMKPYDRCPGWTVFDVQEEYAKGLRRRSLFWPIDVASSLS